MLMTKTKLFAAIPLIAVSAAATVQAEELSVVGSWSGLPLHKQYEAPFWTEKLPDASGGDLTATLTTHDQMGISGGDVFRMLSEGVFDVGMTVADYAVSDSVALEGLDVPLIASDAATAQKAVKLHVRWLTTFTRMSSTQRFSELRRIRHRWCSAMLTSNLWMI